MSALVVDTSAWISYFKDFGIEAISEALQEGRVHLPPLVTAELLSAKLTPANHLQLTQFLNDLNECNNDFAHWVRVGELRRELSRKGVHTSTPDAHIAQCALDLSAELLTEDKIFELIQKHTKLKLHS